MAITELRPRLDLREDLELLGVEVREGIDPSALAEWSTAQREFPTRTIMVITTLIGAFGHAHLGRLGVLRLVASSPARRHTHRGGVFSIAVQARFERSRGRRSAHA